MTSIMAMEEEAAAGERTEDQQVQLDSEGIHWRLQ